MEFLSNVWHSYLVDILDILFVSYIFYKLLLLIKGTRAVQVLRGLTILIIVTAFAQVLHFQTVGWILKWFWVAGIIAVVIVFQPEMRAILADIGQSHPSMTNLKEKLAFMEEIIGALAVLKAKRCGALIVIEQTTGLRNYAETGIPVDGRVSSELLCSIFMSTAPIHDGAVIIKDERLIAAGCILPLASERDMRNITGTRHQAAIGIAEVSDAFVIVVSAERGEISLVYGRNFERNINSERVKEALADLYKIEVGQTRIFVRRNFKKERKDE